ncbi:MAG: thioredoxin family protein [Nitratireductor sp.]
MLTRRNFSSLAVLGGATLASGIRTSPASATLNDDGLHVQPWLIQSFLDLREDQADSAAANKTLMVMFEQKGCPYCREMHEVNFTNPEILEYLQANFGVLQLNLWGARGVTDFDGEESEERELARKWAVNFTPTIVFFSREEPEMKPGNQIEVARMPGYFKPFHFISMLEFVHEERFRDTQFQRFLQEKFEKLEAEGKKPDVW